MAVEFDAGSRTNDNSPGTSTSWTHVTDADATVLISHGSSRAGATSTYDGNDLTFIQASPNPAKLMTHYIVNPSSGSNTMTWSWTGSDNFVGGAITLKGTAIDSNVIGAKDATANTGTSVSITITTTRDDSMNVDGWEIDGTHSSVSTTGSNQTERYTDDTFADLDGRGSTQPTTSAGSYTMSWSWSTTREGRQSMVEMRVSPPSFQVDRGFQVDTDRTLTTDLVAYYKLEDVNDYYGSYDLTNNGTTPFNAGKVNDAADFGASNTTKYLRVADDLGIQNTTFSVSAWVKVTTQPSNSEDLMWNHGDGGVKVWSYITYVDASGTKTLVFRRNKAGVSVSSATYTVTLTTGVWYHLVATYNSGTGDMELFVDGVSRATANQTGTGIGAVGDEFSISGQNGGSLFSGLADEVGVWSKILSSTEIDDLYNSGSGQTMVSSDYAIGSLTRDLVSYYKLEDVSDIYGTNILTNTGSVTFPSGKVNDGADSGSSNTTKEMRVSSNMNIDGGNASISAWIKVNTAPSTDTYHAFVSQNSANTKTGYGLWYHNDGGTLKVFFVRDPVGGSFQGVEVTKTLTIGTWYHLVLTYNSTNIEGWIDDVSQGTSAASGNGSYGPTPNAFCIFANATTVLNQTSSALIDEAGIWSKSFSEKEIDDLYNSGSGQTMIVGEEVVKSLTDAINFGEFLINASEIKKALTISFIESLIDTSVVLREQTDSFSFDESLIRVFEAQRALTDSFGVSESEMFDSILNIIDSLSLSELLLLLTSSQISKEEILTLSEVIQVKFPEIWEYFIRIK